MSSPERVVLLFDVDNTLLDNDAVQLDLSQRLEREFGAVGRDRYWSLFEALRAEVGYADYLGSLQRYRLHVPEEALAAIAHLQRLGPTVILSDGDVVMQPRKIQRSGLWDAVQGRVLIYIHKEQMLDTVERSYPARQYGMVDDKLRILTAVKQHWGQRVT